MKSILQNIVLMSMILLVASCDSGVGNGLTNISVGVASPTNGLNGTVTKGVVSGATITVTDATGADVPIESGATTNADGTFKVIFAQAAIAAGYNAPLTVTVDAGGATAMCDYYVDGTNDCPVGDGTFAAYGSTYTLEAGLVLTGTISSVPTSSSITNPNLTVDVTPASTIATSLAQNAAAGVTLSPNRTALTTPAGVASTLTATQATSANHQILGLIQMMTGVDMTGFNLIDVPAINLNNLDATTDAAPDASYAVLAFSVGLFGLIDGTTVTNVQTALSALLGQMSVDANGNLQMSGANLLKLQTAVAKGIDTVNMALAAHMTPRSAMTSAVDVAKTQKAFLATIVGGCDSTDTSGCVPIPSVSVAGSTTGLDSTKVFIGKLGTMIGRLTATTGAQGVGTSPSPTEALGAQIDSVKGVSSAVAGAAAEQFKTAVMAGVASMAADGDLDLSTVNQGVTGTLTRATDATTGAVTFTITGGTSTATDGTITVVLSVPTGARVSGAELSAGSADTPLTLVASDASGTLETFSGTLDAKFVDEAPDSGLSELHLTGSITTTADADSFGVTADVTGITGITSASSQPMTADLSATLTFTGATSDDISVTVNGSYGSETQTWSVTAGDASGSPVTLTGGVTHMSGADSEYITDGTVYATFQIANGNTLVGPDGTGNKAVLTVGMWSATATPTGTIDKNGVVTYSDNSIQVLPSF
ncbi:MAG TPA: hypothetical protein VJ998_04780 [Pseudomonadales bacterium]|nr:hypothetical protein [Pseudomonadales bacterium]